MLKYLILLFCLLSAIANAQTKIVPVKKNGQYVAPMYNPVTGAVSDVLVDSVNFWKPPVVVPPTDDTTKIDGRNGTFVGSWSHAVNTAEGWYKNTLSFSNVAGNTATYRFQGTKLELWGERKTSHGTGTVTIKLGTTVIDTKSVTFVGATLIPALIYTSPNLTPNTNYTIELRVTSGWNLIDFLTIWNYQESTVGPDPEPPIPPDPGNLINVSPGQDVYNIIRTASNCTLNFLPGRYNLQYVTVPPTVNLQAQTAWTATIVGTSVSSSVTTTEAVLKLTGSSSGQFIKGLIIDGNNKSNGGIWVTNRDNVTLDVRVINHKFFGIWLSDTQNGVVNAYLKDNSYCNTSWASGEIVLGGYVNNYELNLDWYTTTASRGYGLKILWQNGSNAALSANNLGNVKINLLGGELNHYSNWNNGQSRNIGVELFGCKITGDVTITGTIKNQISLHPQQSVKQIRIHDFVADTKDTYFIESIASNTKVEDGVIYNTGMMGANFQNNEHISNVWFDNVRFVQPNGLAMSYGAVHLIGHKGVSNYRLTNCYVEVLRGFPLVKYYGSPASGVTIDGTNTIKQL